MKVVLTQKPLLWKSQIFLALSIQSVYHLLLPTSLYQYLKNPKKKRNKKLSNIKAVSKTITRVPNLIAFKANYSQTVKLQ